MGDNAGAPEVKPDVITREVDSSDVAVAEVRKEVQPTEVGASVPIDRLSLRPNLVMMANAGVTTAAFGSTDRCIRVVTVPTKGGQTVQCHCSRPCVRVGADKLCPDHDAGAFQPSQTPVAKGRTINSASIKLSKAELKECGLESEPEPSSPAQAVIPGGSPTVIAKVGGAAISGESLVRLSFTLEELASGSLLGVFQNRVVEALDSMPCSTRKQMKQMDAIQEKVLKLGKRAKMKVLKPKEGNANDAQ